MHGQRRRVDKAADLATYNHTNLMPVTEGLILYERGAQRQPTRLLRYIQHVSEIDAGAREIGCRTSHVRSSLKSIVSERKMLFRKSFHGSAPRGIIGEGETWTIACRRYHRLAITFA